MTVDLDSYIEAALFSSTDESEEGSGEPLDQNFGPEDLDSETLAAMTRDCEEFEKRIAHLDFDGVWVRGYPASGSQIAHDFWLTRNGHGSGFWDGDWPEELGEELTEIAKSFGEVWLCVGDDGKISSYPACVEKE